MASLKLLLERKYSSSVYWLNTAERVSDIAQLAKDFHFYFMYLDGTKINTGGQYLDAIREVTECPYMGDNWNAALDCMRDLEWLSSYRGFILLYDNVEVFASHEPDFFTISLETLHDAAGHWRNVRQNSQPMYILLRGDLENLSKLEKLPN